MRFSNILLVLDSKTGNALALTRAIQLARNENAGITVCDMVDPIPGRYSRLITSITPREVSESIIATRLDRIEALLRTVDTDELSIDTKVLIGRSHIEIPQLVREGKYDLVIKPIARRRAMRARAVTRKDRELMRHCPGPVWLVNVADLSDNGRIVAALDMPGDGAISTRLNEEILRVSRSIALATFRPLHVVHAWTLAGEGHLRARGTAESNLEVDRMVSQEAENRTEWLRRAVYTSRSDSEQVATDFLSPELHVVKGTASDVLPNLAQELEAGLIVMGTAARSGLPGMLIGNTSEAVVSRADCSLLIVRQPSSISSPASRGEVASKPQLFNTKQAELPFAGVPHREVPTTMHENNERRQYNLWF